MSRPQAELDKIEKQKQMEQLARRQARDALNAELNAQKIARMRAAFAIITDETDIIADFAKIDELQPYLDELVKRKNIIERKDTRVANIVMGTDTKESPVIKPEEFPSKIRSLPAGSLAIYIQPAELYKIYSPESISQFENEYHTHYRYPKNGPVYEVVKDDQLQKLLIRVDDKISDNSLTQVKQWVLEFLHMQESYATVKPSDLTVFNNDDTTEFLLSCVQFSNIFERDSYIRDLIRFLRKKDDDLASLFANKIITNNQVSDIEGIQLYRLPSLETPMSGVSSSDALCILNQLLSVTSATATPIVINNITNSNYTIAETVAIGNSNTIKTVKKPVSRHVQMKTFYKHLYDTRPDWYEVGVDTWVEIEHIVKEYRDFFDDDDTRKSEISKNLSSLFVKSKRSNGSTVKQLISFEKLKTLC